MPEEMFYSGKPFKIGDKEVFASNTSCPYRPDTGIKIGSGNCLLCQYFVQRSSEKSILCSFEEDNTGEIV